MLKRLIYWAWGFNMNKVTVYTTYDTAFGTWNAMDASNQCLFYGSIDGLETWLDENKDKYQEGVK